MQLCLRNCQGQEAPSTPPNRPVPLPDVLLVEMCAVIAKQNLSCSSWCCCLCPLLRSAGERGSLLALAVGTGVNAGRENLLPQLLPELLFLQHGMMLAAFAARACFWLVCGLLSIMSLRPLQAKPVPWSCKASPRFVFWIAQGEKLQA